MSLQLLVSQVLKILRAGIAQRLAEAVVAVLRKHQQRAKFLRVFPHEAGVLDVAARGDA